MTECVNYEKCRYFIDNMKNSPSTATLVQNSYCRHSFEACARYMIYKALGEAKMPRDLSPSETERAEQLIKGS